MKSKLLILTLIFAIGAIVVLAGKLHSTYTCAADNQQLQSVIKNWGTTNTDDLSKILSQMGKHHCGLQEQR